MECSDLMPFSSVVACLLLLDRDITSLEISNFLSLLDCEGIAMDDSNDEIGDLLLCVQDKGRFSYSIKDGLSYDTKIGESMTVYDFLESFVDERLFTVLKSYNFYFDKYKKNLPLNREFSYIVKKSPFFNSLNMGKDSLKKVKKRNPWYFILFR